VSAIRCCVCCVGAWARGGERRWAASYPDHFHITSHCLTHHSLTHSTPITPQTEHTPRLSSSMENAKAKFGGLGRNLKDKISDRIDRLDLKDKLDERLDSMKGKLKELDAKVSEKVADSKALTEAKSRLSGGAASFRRCAAGGLLGGWGGALWLLVTGVVVSVGLLVAYFQHTHSRQQLSKTHAAANPTHAPGTTQAPHLSRRPPEL